MYPIYKKSLRLLRATKKFCRYKSNWLIPEGYDTGIKVYNCILRDKVPFIVRNKNYVSWYTCGPTVYDSAHMGHASSYVKFDIIQRTLRDYFNLNLVTAMNITDVDDKIIKKSVSLKKSCEEISNSYESEFWDNLDLLNVQKPNIVLRVSEQIRDISDFIKELIVNEQAYIGQDGSVYFDVIKYENYGKLQKLNKDDFSSSNVKRNSMDFALWKTNKPDEPFWESSFGNGRPGWHIECSTLASIAFGKTIDVHAGGIDLRFPHHENEETQSCAYHKVDQWVNYWLHTGQLHIKSEKMSKSLNNSVKINDFLHQRDPNVFRLSCLLSHYRNSTDYNDDLLENAENVLNTYKSFFNQCNAFITIGIKLNVDEITLFNTLTSVMQDIDVAIRDDFDTSVVMKKLSYLMNVTNKMLNNASTVISTDSKQLTHIGIVISISNYVKKILNVFGINLSRIIREQTVDNSTDYVNMLVEVREKLRSIGLNNKDKNLLDLCDGIRDDLTKLGVNVKDHGKRSSWSYS